MSEEAEPKLAIRIDKPKVNSLTLTSLTSIANSVSRVKSELEFRTSVAYFSKIKQNFVKCLQNSSAGSYISERKVKVLMALSISHNCGVTAVRFSTFMISRINHL